MANVQHIFTSESDPVGAAPVGSHHINSLSGDIWQYGTAWSLLHSQNAPEVPEYMSGYTSPTSEPTGPAIYVKHGGADYAVFISVFKGDEYWGWVKVLATDFTI